MTNIAQLYFCPKDIKIIPIGRTSTINFINILIAMLLVRLVHPDVAKQKTVIVNESSTRLSHLLFLCVVFSDNCRASISLLTFHCIKGLELFVLHKKLNKVQKFQPINPLAGCPRWHFISTFCQWINPTVSSTGKVETSSLFSLAPSKLEPLEIRYKKHMSRKKSQSVYKLH